MSKAPIDRITLFIAALGVVVTIACAVLRGPHAAMSAGIGAALALVNFMFLRSIVARVVGLEIKASGKFVGLLFLKMGGLMAAVFIVIIRGWVEPIAFTLGMSSLVVGLIVSSLLFAQPSAQSAANQES